MNVLFLTMNVFTDIEMHNIYSDLMKEFIKQGHRPYIVTPREKKLGEKTELIEYPEYSLLKVQIGNTSNVSLVEKGISTVLLSSQFFHAIKDKLGNLQFDLILYSTPPITLATPVVKLKKLFGSRTYLMLKDIFPQNAVDLEMFSNKSLIYWYFRRQEKKLYAISDKIGCMSPANREYVLKNNSFLVEEKVEICPNAIIPHPLEDRTADKMSLRKKYCVPDGATVYLYGGNLGKPQGIPFLLECLEKLKNTTNAFFLICGSGSEYWLIEKFVQEQKPQNMRLIQFLPKHEYDSLVRGSDVGLVFLDYRFTIPNFPSRALSYMECGLPMIICTDKTSDLGNIAEENGFGWFCPSNDVEMFTAYVNEMTTSEIDARGAAARSYLIQEYLSVYAYNQIIGERK